MRKNIALDRWELFPLSRCRNMIQQLQSTTFGLTKRDSRGSLPTAAQRADSFA
jgi:hypothetical protein